MSEPIELSIHLGILHVNGGAALWNTTEGRYVAMDDLEEGGVYSIDVDSGVVVRTNREAGKQEPE